MNFITIDCGASFIKMGLFDENGILLKKARYAAPKSAASADGIFCPRQMPLLMDRIREIVDSLSRECKGEIRLSVSNEMHGFLLVKEDGTLFCDYISWQKEFGRLETPEGVPVEIMKGELQKLIHKSGMPLRAGLPAVNLYYLSLSRYLEAEEKLYFYTLGDYILRELSGKTVACHPSNAAASGLYDLSDGDWNWELIGVVVGKRIVFPEIADRPFSFEYAGKQFVAVPALGDYQAAMLGAGITAIDTLSFNLGTGGQVSRLVDCLETEAFYSVNGQICPFFDGKYLKRIAFIPSGRAMNVYIRFIKDICHTFGREISDGEIWEQVVKAVSYGEEKECDISMDLSFFENPLSDHVGGGISNIGEYDLTFKNLMASLLSKAAENYLECADRLFPDKEEVGHILFTGGIACKLEYIRKAVLEHYGNDIDYRIVTNETLLGGYRHLKNVIQRWERF